MIVLRHERNVRALEPWKIKKLLNRSQYLTGAFNSFLSIRVAGEEGFEPSHAGIKIRCLNQLGDSPTILQSSAAMGVHLNQDKPEPNETLDAKHSYFYQRCAL